MKMSRGYLVAAASTGYPYIQTKTPPTTRNRLDFPRFARRSDRLTTARQQAESKNSRPEHDSLPFQQNIHTEVSPLTPAGAMGENPHPTNSGLSRLPFRTRQGSRPAFPRKGPSGSLVANMGAPKPPNGSGSGRSSAVFKPARSTPQRLKMHGKGTNGALLKRPLKPAGSAQSRRTSCLFSPLKAAFSGFYPLSSPNTPLSRNCSSAKRRGPTRSPAPWAP